jgi:ABC-2 type transport system permease protein
LLLMVLVAGGIGGWRLIAAARSPDPLPPAAQNEAGA